MREHDERIGAAGLDNRRRHDDRVNAIAVLRREPEVLGRREMELRETLLVEGRERRGPRSGSNRTIWPGSVDDEWRATITPGRATAGDSPDRWSMTTTSGVPPPAGTRNSFTNPSSSASTYTCRLSGLTVNALTDRSQPARDDRRLARVRPGETREPSDEVDLLRGGVAGLERVQRPAIRTELGTGVARAGRCQPARRAAGASRVQRGILLLDHRPIAIGRGVKHDRLRRRASTRDRDSPRPVGLKVPRSGRTARP